MQKGFVPILILVGILVVLVGGLVFTGYEFNKGKNLSTNLSVPTPTLLPTSMPTPEEPKPPLIYRETPVSTLAPTSTAISTLSAKVDLTFIPKYTTESISKFLVELMKYGEVRPFLSFNGTGNSYTFEKLEPGEYRVEAYVEDRLQGLCSKTAIETSVTKENDPYFFTVKTSSQLQKAIQIYPYPGMVNLLTEDGYPISGIEINTTNRSGVGNYYSTKTDTLGRAVVYTINPKPQYIKVKLPAGNLIKELTEGDCLWWETINVPLVIPRGKIVVNVENQTSNLQNATVYLAKSATSVEIKPNSVMHGTNFEAFHRGAFSYVASGGSESLVSIKTLNISLNPGETKAVSFDQVALGDYRVLSRTSSYMLSNIATVQLLSTGETKNVSLTFQYQ